MATDVEQVWLVPALGEDVRCQIANRRVNAPPVAARCFLRVDQGLGKQVVNRDLHLLRQTAISQVVLQVTT